MESRKFIGDCHFGRYSGKDRVHHPAHHIDKSVEDAQYPTDTKHIEDEVCQSCTPCLRVGSERGNIGSDSSTDVFTHHQCDTQIQIEHAAGTENQRDGHHCCRRLRTHGNDAAYQQKKQNRKSAPFLTGGNEIDDCRIVFKIHLQGILAQGGQSQKHERKAEDKLSERLLLALA